MSQRGAAGSPGVARWHLFLLASAWLNMVLWLLSAAAVTHTSPALPVATGNAARIQLLLSLVYVVGCAFRCLLPVYDIPRIVLVDSPLSSVVVGRSVATVAELCFAAQWALTLHRIASLSDDPLMHTVSLAIVPLVVVAELCSWYAVLTTAQQGHVLENSIWGLSGALVVISLLMIGAHRLIGLYRPIIAWCVAGAAYVAFIFFFDVPMYWSRWRADRGSGRHSLGMAEGLLDICRRRVVSCRWEDWRSEIPWMSLYFTLGVWSSVSLVYASIALRP